MASHTGHASWLNIAECELSILRRRCLRPRMPGIKTVSEKVLAWMGHRKARHMGIDWRFTTEEKMPTSNSSDFILLLTPKNQLN